MGIKGKKAGHRYFWTCSSYTQVGFHKYSFQLHIYALHYHTTNHRYTSKNLYFHTSSTIYSSNTVEKIELMNNYAELDEEKSETPPKCRKGCRVLVGLGECGRPQEREEIETVWKTTGEKKKIDHRERRSTLLST